MTNDLQSLEVVARLFPLVLTGEKTSTIRWRERRVVQGLMRFVCRGDPTKSTIVKVTRCTDMPLSEVAAFVGKEDEWSDDVMLEGMREHYPEIELSDIVQVIEYQTPDQTRSPE